MLEYSKLIEETEKAISWIKEFVKKSGANGVVIGNSGGKDTATVIAMATKALGKENVLAVAMPCFSIKEDLEDANLVAQKFGVNTIIADLSSSYTELENTITEACDFLVLKEESKINIKPRMRMTILYAIAQSLNYLVIGTGNLSERMVGYTTKWGDSASDFNPIANFTAQEVIEIGKYLGVPDKITNKAPSDGLSGKSDEEKMGITYKQISEYIETGKTDMESMEKIKKMNINSKHKREPVPTYKVDRTNYLK